MRFVATVKDRIPMAAFVVLCLATGFALIYAPAMAAWGAYEVGGLAAVNFVCYAVLTAIAAVLVWMAFAAVKYSGFTWGRQVGRREGAAEVTPIVEGRVREETLDLVSSGILPQDKLLAGRYKILSMAAEQSEGTTLVIMKGDFGGRRAERVVRLQTRHAQGLVIDGIYDYEPKPSPTFDRVG